MIQWPGIMNKIIPNLLFVGMAVTSAIYYDLKVTDVSPTWQNVAVGSMALVGTLAGLGYREFMKKMELMNIRIAESQKEIEKERKEISDELKEDRKRRDQQHKANVAAIVALSMSVMDKMSVDQRDKVQEVVHKLLEDGPSGG